MWPFKRKAATPAEKGFGTIVIPRAALEESRNKLLVEAVEKVIKDFANVVQDLDPMAFYDVSLLPHPKDLIERALVGMIKIADGRGDSAESSNLRVVLEALTQYQAGVGKVPIRILPASIDGLSPQEVGRAIVDHAENGDKTRWERFNRMAAVDRARHATRLARGS